LDIAVVSIYFRQFQISFKLGTGATSHSSKHAVSIIMPDALTTPWNMTPAWMKFEESPKCISQVWHFNSLLQTSKPWTFAGIFHRDLIEFSIHLLSETIQSRVANLGDGVGLRTYTRAVFSTCVHAGTGICMHLFDSTHV
jgi:hypothetical protein